MILLRWFAIGGQLIAITVGQMFFGLQLELGLCYLAIGASVLANLIATFVFPENKRLSERENLMMVLFDLMQLSFLLFLTGGLHNPFALLLLGPVTISATALSLRSTALLCGVAILAISILSKFHLDLRTHDGEVLEIPALFLFGHWAALIIAILFTTGYSRRVTTEIHSMSDALAATQMALAREQKLTDLGGIVAAAAHELGTPLATIKLASTELVSELADQPELREDAALICDQTDRCRDILRNMGREENEDIHMRQAPLMAVIQEAAEPHLARGKDVVFDYDLSSGAATEQPSIIREPEIIHGLRNLIQNAVDFADTLVQIEARWTDAEIAVLIVDDGPGFPTQLFGRIGDPFMRRHSRRTLPAPRAEYQGMGLGLFIAKTLLERTGAKLRFANGSEESIRPGAIVEVTWKRANIDARMEQNRITLEQNRPIVA